MIGIGSTCLFISCGGLEDNPDSALPASVITHMLFADGSCYENETDANMAKYLLHNHNNVRLGRCHK